MDNLNNIPNAGNWGDASSKLNDNFNKIKQAVTTVENASKNNKGYFTSLSALNSAFPRPKAGQTAYVYGGASSTNYYIYNAVNGAWVTASIEAPPVGVAIAEYTKSGGSTKTTKEVDDDLTQLEGDLSDFAKTVTPNSVEIIKNQSIGSVSGSIIQNSADSRTETIFVYHDKIYADPLALTRGFAFYSNLPIGTSTFIEFNYSGDVPEGAKYVSVRVHGEPESIKIWQGPKNIPVDKKLSSNLCNPEQLTPTYISILGIEAASVTTNMTGFIPIKNGETLYCSMKRNSPTVFHAIYRGEVVDGLIEESLTPSTSNSITNTSGEDGYCRMALDQEDAFPFVSSDEFGTFEFYNEVIGYSRKEFERIFDSMRLGEADLTIGSSTIGIATINRTDFIPITKGSIIKYIGQMESDNHSVVFLYDINKNQIWKGPTGSPVLKKGSFMVEEDGYVVFQSYNDTHLKYDPSIEFHAEISYIFRKGINNNSVNVSVDKKLSRNLCNPEQLTPTYLNLYGVENPSVTTNTTGFIPIKNGETLYCSMKRDSPTVFHAIYRGDVVGGVAIEESLTPSTSNSITNTSGEDGYCRMALSQEDAFPFVSNDEFGTFEFYNEAMGHSRKEFERVFDSMRLDEADLTIGSSTVGATTVNRTDFIPITKGSIIKYFGQMISVNHSVVILYDINKNQIGQGPTGEPLLKKGSFLVEEDGYVIFQSYNDTHVAYDPSIEFHAEISYIFRSGINNNISDKDSIGYFTKTKGDNFSVKALKEVAYEDGTLPRIGAVLWNDTNEDEFYISKNFSSNREHLFTWDIGRAKGSPSGMYSALVMPNGDILFVFRTEFSGGSMSDDNRRNPILYVAEDNYTPIEIEFGDSLKPTGSLQDVGLHYSYRHNRVYLAEYTRLNIPTARVWTIDLPLTDPDNWVVKLEKDVILPYGSGFKHFHGAQVDPFTGVVYFTSGDDDTSSAVWYSTDGGDSLTQLDDYNKEKYRMLNMIFLKDYIYWTADQWDPEHTLWRATRNVNGVMDKNSLTKMYEFVDRQDGESLTPRIATYSTVYMECYNALVMFDRADGVYQIHAKYIPVRLYDLNTDTMHVLGRVYQTEDISRAWGFRNEVVTKYPKSNEIVVSFGQNYPNYIKRFDNDGSPSNQINTLLISINKDGDNYSMIIDTIN